MTAPASHGWASTAAGAAHRDARRIGPVRFRPAPCGAAFPDRRSVPPSAAQASAGRLAWCSDRFRLATARATSRRLWPANVVRASGPVRRGWDDWAMTCWSSPSPSPSAWRFRDRPCLPSLRCLATFASHSLRNVTVRPTGRRVQPATTFIRQPVRQSLRFAVPCWCQPCRRVVRYLGKQCLRIESAGFAGVSEARSYHPQRIRCFDGGKLLPLRESRNKFQMQLPTGAGRTGG